MQYTFEEIKKYQQEISALPVVEILASEIDLTKHIRMLSIGGVKFGDRGVAINSVEQHGFTVTLCLQSRQYVEEGDVPWDTPVIVRLKDGLVS